MIRCKLVEYTNPDASQTQARMDRAVAGEVLGIGRAASCRIYLPDPRVRLEHAAIRRAEDGYLYLDAAGPVFVNQRASASRPDSSRPTRTPTAPCRPPPPRSPT